jgi:general secretion pathway protein G
MMLALSQRHGLQVQRGFTLIELLVVLAIMAILAAIVTFGVVTFLNTANKNACVQEKSTVQAAMDAMMASTSSTAVPTDNSPTKNWADAPGAASAKKSLYNAAAGDSYLRNQYTKYAYSWTGDGKVSVQAAPCT